MARSTKDTPDQDHLEELFHELRRSHKGGQRPPRAIWLPAVLLMTLGGLGVLAVGAYYGGTHLLGLNTEDGDELPISVRLEDLGPAPTIGDLEAWAVIESGYVATGQPIVIQVWTDSQCPGCLVHARLLNKAHFETDRVFDPLWVFSTPDAEDFEEAAALAEESGVDWPVGWDASGRVAAAFPGDAAVSTYIIDQEGMLRFATTGAPEDIVLNRLVWQLTGTGPLLDDKGG